MQQVTFNMVIAISHKQILFGLYLLLGTMKTTGHISVQPDYFLFGSRSNEVKTKL